MTRDYIDHWHIHSKYRTKSLLSTVTLLQLTLFFPASHTELSSTNWVAQIVKITPPWRGPRRKHSPSIAVQVCSPCIAMVMAQTTENTLLLLLSACCRHYLATAAVYSHRLATSLYATIHTQKNTDVLEQKFINYDIYLGKDGTHVSSDMT
jgi:hypothetical protein